MSETQVAPTFDAEYIQALAIFSQAARKMPDGTKPIVICGGVIEEAKDLDAAQAKAEELAHSKSANVYILKPVKKVAPKRDTVTTDL